MTRLGTDLDMTYPDYFCWLCELVCVDGRYTDEAYWVLAKHLWNTDYYWLLDMDGNRAFDGIDLRHRYELHGGTEGYDGPCTVLEMLVALADRLDQTMDELDGECRITMFFWEMIGNLGLSNYSDHIFEENPKRAKVYGRRIDQKLEAWMDRRFDYNGAGGLFPLRNPQEDQRDVEYWYQANAYILENYWE